MSNAATADQIRKRPRYVPVPGTKPPLLIEVRPPEPLAMIAQNVLPLDIYAGVLEVITKWASTGDGPDLIAEARKAPKVWGDFIDRWVCAAAVAPVIVITEDEALKDQAKLWVDELDLDVKLEIMRVTNTAFRSPRLGDAVTEFRRVRPEGDSAGPNSEAVRVPAVGAPGDSGPEPSA